jgi:hypothetical protein|tara:strand:- start:8596 stop:9018 length:423 start_codon:yes stop_codon:yes gene_type:complete
MSVNLKQRTVLALCLLAGLMDSSSGMLLMTAPAFTMGLMQLDVSTVELLVFIRFIGAFVFSVGMLYVFAWLQYLRSESWQPVRAVLLMTAWVRLVICFFTAVAIATGDLPVGWASVTLTDGCLAALQLWIVLKEWVSRDD